MPHQKKVIEVGGSTVAIYFSSEKAVFKWKEGGRWRNSNRKVKSLDEARKIARDIARRLELDKAGRKLVTVEEYELLEKLKSMADGSPWEWLELAGRKMGAGGSDITLGAAYRDFFSRYEGSPIRTQQNMRFRVGRHVEANSGLKVALLSSEALESWIDSDNAKTFNGKLAEWVGFANWLVRKGYLRRDLPTFAHEIERRQEVRAMPKILSLAEGRKLWGEVQVNHPSLVPFFVLCGFLGVRVSEAKRLTWEAFDFELGGLEVSELVSKKTSQARWVPIPSNVLAVLRGFRGDAASLVLASRDDRRFRDFAKGCLGGWPPNVLRKSFISYRLEQCGSFGRVAAEAGTSEGRIRINYRRPVLPGSGDSWFEIASSS